MKSERVQEQNRKLQQMESLVGAEVDVRPSVRPSSSPSLHASCRQVEKNLALEDQLIHALQQNEDLRVRRDNCQTLIQ